MQIIAKSVAFLVPLVVLAQAEASHPIEKVIEMLKGLSSKAELEGKAEALTFEKFQYWCKNSVKTLESAIKEEKTTIDELESTIASKTENAATLTDQIAKLKDQIAEMQLAGEKAGELRDKENRLYTEADADFDATIAAVKEALAGLEKARDETEAASLVQRALPFVSAGATDAQRHVLEAFVQASQEPDRESQGVERPEQLAKGDREAHVDKYASKSHSVIELLKGLQQQFEEEKLAATKAETNAMNAYDVSKLARDDAIKAAETSEAKKTTELEDTNRELQEAKDSLKATQDELEDDSKALKDTQQSCARKGQEWEERSKTRAGEIEAMAMAVKILAKAANVRTEAPNNPVPPPSPLEAERASEAESLLQLGSASPKAKAIKLLRLEASRVHSKALERLAQEVAAHLTGPFDVVNNMIEKMIFRLMDEQKNEDDHKNWCDLELEKTNTSIVNKEEKRDELNAKITEEKAAVQKLTEDIEEADKMIADIVSHMKMAEEVRAVGKKENALAIADAERGQTAVADATAVLEEFYKESGKVPKEDWEFLQRGVDLPEKPSTWDSSYTGVSDPQSQPNGIITILESVATEFATMEADTKAQEASDQKDYDQEMKDSKIEKARRESQSNEWNHERKGREERIVSLSKALKHTEGELEKTEQYLADLQPACVEGDSTYEDRKAARAQETDALREAQGILADAFKEKVDEEAERPEKEEPASLMKRRLRHIHRVA